jgi:small subunit ribosomal protein S10
MNQTIPKFRIILKAFNAELLNVSCKKICEAISGTDSKLIGPIPMPTITKRFCVLRSPHVDKDSREVFQIQYFKRIIDIETNSALVVDRFMKLTMPAGVFISIKKQ